VAVRLLPARAAERKDPVSDDEAVTFKYMRSYVADNGVAALCADLPERPAWLGGTWAR
jgi:hypothetical protein